MSHRNIRIAAVLMNPSFYRHSVALKKRTTARSCRRLPVMGCVAAAPRNEAVFDSGRTCLPRSLDSCSCVFDREANYRQLRL
jgi:hypothetical protein